MPLPWRTLLFTGTTLWLTVPVIAPGDLRTDGAEAGIWHAVTESTLSAPDPSRRIESTNYRTVSLDRGKLVELLARAPLEGSEDARKTDVVLELPWPDGSFKKFRIEETSMVERGLPVWCPDLKTYLGRTIGGSAAVRFDWSPSGLHAEIVSGEASVFIGPHSPGDAQDYVVYYARDWRPGPEQTEGAPPATRAAPGPPPAVPFSPAHPSPASIERIELTRGGFASEYPYTLTFSPDGTATLKTMAVRRHNTVDHTCRGSVKPDDFTRLATLIQTEGFFELNEIYHDPRTQDGEVVSTSADVDRRTKGVHNANQAGPPNLKAIEDAIHALGKNVAWVVPRTSKENGVWHAVTESTLSAPDPSRRIESTNYRTVSLDRGKLVELLARAPLEGSEDARKTDVVLELPWPDGSLRRFRIEEASNTEPGLAVRCPDAKTYRGWGNDDWRAYVRLDWSPSGLYAQVNSDKEVSIAPYSRGDTTNYIVYYSRDWSPGPEQTEKDAAAGEAAAGRRAMPAPPAQVSAVEIDEITIERRCFRCENRYKLTFRRDGTATLTILAFTDHTCGGTMAPEDFAALAALAQREDFFGLSETYHEPSTQDGAWVTTSISGERWRKSVTNSNEAGPPRLKAIEDAIHALARKVAWKGATP